MAAAGFAPAARAPARRRMRYLRQLHRKRRVTHEQAHRPEHVLRGFHRPHTRRAAMTVLVVMGVSGSGKTTIGQALARRLDFEFIEGDEFHSRANREKMHQGVPLTDADREPWLETLRSRMTALLSRNGNAVLTCSALRKSYRDRLRMNGVRFVYLKVSEPVVRERLAKRRGHFFNPALLESQFATLEEPRDALVVDADRPDLEVTQQIVHELGFAAPDVRARRASKA
jgi:gluconokinase